jgi:hypothetical protein
VNRSLLAIASGALAVGGHHADSLLHSYSDACQVAIAASNELDVHRYCPPGFNDLDLVFIIAAVIGAVAIHHWHVVWHTLRELWESAMNTRKE